MLLAIEELGYPLDAIVAVDVWATDDLPAELPPMLAFKDEWDRKCEERFGIPVTRICAKDIDGKKKTYEDVFYRKRKESKDPNKIGQINGFPHTNRSWCRKELKTNALRKANIINLICSEKGKRPIYYVGISADEDPRASRLIDTPDRVLPLVDIGWGEEKCREIAEELGMLSPVYQNSFRDGCWFCHYQGREQMRFLRKNYPELWEKLLEWDSDSPVCFKACGHTVRDFDRRFKAEDDGLAPKDLKFRWKKMDEYEKAGKTAE